MATQVTTGSGNVFEDLGFPDARERLAKADLAIRIGRAIEERGMTPAVAARRGGISGAELSDLRRGRLEAFGIARLETVLGRVESLA